MGAALAHALVERGIEVTLIASRSLASHPDWIDPRVTVVPYGSFLELQAALHAHTEVPPDLLFMAAAVSDYAPVPAEGKLRSDADELVVRMVKNPKLLPGLRERCGPDTLICGFKLLSGVSAARLLEVARAQIAAGRLDLCLANDMAELTGGAHPAWIVPAEGDARRTEGSKADTAAALADEALARRGVAPRATPLAWTPLELGPAPDDAVVDAIGDALAAERRWVRTGHPEPFVARGWRPEGALLRPPTLRDDLRQAASVCLWHRESDQVLLGRRLVGPYPDHWSFPGGGVEPDDADAHAAALRELHEETGIRLPPEAPVRRVTQLHVGDGSRAWHLTNLLVEVTTPLAPAPTPELDARWVPRLQAGHGRTLAAGTRRVLRHIGDTVTHGDTAADPLG